MKILVLPSARDGDARTNLAAFIEKGKASTSLGPIDWSQSVWLDLVMTVKTRSATKRPGSLHFTINGGERGAGEPVPLPEPFADFLKSAIRLRETFRPTVIENLRAGVRAGRYLCSVMGDIGYDPILLSPDHFDRAAKLARDAESDATAYRTGQQLLWLAQTIVQNNLARVMLDWTNIIPAPHNYLRVGEKAAALRASKMPSEAALAALPQLSALVTEDRDILRMRVTELLLCTGFRINELLSLPDDPIVEEQVLKGGMPVFGADGEIEVRFGLRYWAEKGYDWTIKWVPTPMVDVARRAIAEIARITQSVRDDAAFLASNPGRVNIPALQDPERLLTISECTALLGSDGNQFLKSRKIDIVPTGGGTRDLAARAGDIAAALLDGTPKGTQYLPLHRHLFLIRRNGVHAMRRPINGTIRFLAQGMIEDFLTGRQFRKTIFERFGFTEPDGGPIKVTTHQFRHWLNTLAQEGGMSQELIARWSGRKDTSQNAAYDHMTGRQLAEKVREMAAQGEVIGQLAKVGNALPPLDRSQFLATQLATAHVTDIGLCSHDWSMVPCRAHGDCATCIEHLIDKGNVAQRTAAEHQLANVEMLLDTAVSEVEEGTYGASRWEVAHTRQRDGLKAVLSVHLDNSIPDGTLVHVGGGIRLIANGSVRRQIFENK